MIGQPLDQLSGDAFDQAFLAQMTMHHAMGVMMTQPVITGGAHQELKDAGRPDDRRPVARDRADARLAPGLVRPGRDLPDDAGDPCPMG